MTQPVSRSALPRDVPVWGSVSFFSDLAHESVTCLLPALLAATGSPALGLGLIEGISDAGATVAKIAGGRAADSRRKLKRLAAGGYALTALTIPALAFARSVPAILFLRLAGWTGRGFRSPIRDTLLASAVDPRDRGRAFGLERALDQTGAVLAPLCVLALLGAGLGLRGIVGITLIPDLVALACVLLFIRERAEHGSGAADSQREADVEPLPRAFRKLIAAVGFFGCGDFAKTLLILWAVGEHLDPLAASARGAALYALLNAASVGAAWIGGVVSDRLGRKPILAAAYGCGAGAALVPVLFSPGTAAGAASLVLSGILIGAEESVERAWASDLAGSRRGWGFGLLAAVNGAGDLVASAGVGILWDLVGPRTAFASAALVMAAGTALILGVSDPCGARRRDENPAGA